MLSPALEACVIISCPSAHSEQVKYVILSPGLFSTSRCFYDVTFGSAHALNRRKVLDTYDSSNQPISSCSLPELFEL